MYKVIKRDGHAAEFSLSCISNAIMKALDATGISYASDVIDLLSVQVTADFAKEVKSDRIGVESIQDSVEAVLQRAGYTSARKMRHGWTKWRRRQRPSVICVCCAARSAAANRIARS